MKSMILNEKEINGISRNFKNVKFVYNATLGDYCIVNIDDYLAFVSLNDKQIKCKSFCGKLKNYDDFADCVIDLKVHNCFKIKGYDSKYVLYNLQLNKVSDRRFNSLFEEGQHIVGVYDEWDDGLFHINKHGGTYFDPNGNTQIDEIRYGVVRVSEKSEISIVLCNGKEDVTLYRDNLEVFMKCKDYHTISLETIWVMDDDNKWYLYRFDGFRFDKICAEKIIDTYGEESETCSLIQLESGKFALVQVDMGKIIFEFDRFKYDVEKGFAILDNQGIVYITDFNSYDMPGVIEIIEYKKEHNSFSEDEISYIENVIKTNGYDLII